MDVTTHSAHRDTVEEESYYMMGRMYHHHTEGCCDVFSKDVVERIIINHIMHLSMIFFLFDSSQLFDGVARYIVTSKKK